MSTWITIKNQENVEFDSLPLTEATIDVYIGSDDFGANYISIPISFIFKVLRENGYEIK